MVVESPAPNRPTRSSSSEEDASLALGSSGRKYVSLREFAIIVGITYQTALKYKNDGVIQVVQVGGRFRIYTEELMRFQREGNLPHDQPQSHDPKGGGG